MKGSIRPGPAVSQEFDLQWSATWKPPGPHRRLGSPIHRFRILAHASCMASRAGGCTRRAPLSVPVEYSNRCSAPNINRGCWSKPDFRDTWLNGGNLIFKKSYVLEKQSVICYSGGRFVPRVDDIFLVKLKNWSMEVGRRRWDGNLDTPLFLKKYFHLSKHSGTPGYYNSKGNFLCF